MAANVPSVTSEWEDLNNLRRFVCAFPTDASTKTSSAELVNCPFIILFWEPQGGS